jgi:type II secretory pathway pseudopilin PulG
MRGFTLLEVVVALLLLELAVAGSLGTLTVASRTLAEAEQLERAVTEVEGVLDSLAGEPDAATGARPTPGGEIEWTIEESGRIVLRATREGGGVWLDVTSALPRP